MFWPASVEATRGSGDITSMASSAGSGDTVAGSGSGEGTRGASWAGLMLALTGRALVNPALAIDLLRLAWRFRHRFWYRRFPFLPLPAMTYLRWRLYTAYGSETIVPPARDVIAFARWVGRDM